MKNKKAITLSIIAIITLLILIIGATYAYFQASGGAGTSANLRVTTYTTDVITFEVGSDIEIYADQTSFASGKGNAAGTTFARATLTANNKTNSATENYNLFLNISDNTFAYSVDTKTPELILTIKDKSNNEVTSIEGLTYKTVTDGKGTSISGYDITNKNGLLTLFNKDITTTSTTVEEWNVTVTFVNYNANQAGNAGKSFNAKLMIQKEKIKETVATVCSNGQTLSSCIIAMDGKDDTLYHHTNSLANGAGDYSYRYAGASESVNNFVCFGSTTSPCPTDNLYRIIGVFGENNHGVTEKQLVKLIKYDYATSNLLGTDGDYQGSDAPGSTYKGSLSKVDTYYWNYKNNTTINSGSGSNIWSTSLLNKINLNTNYLNNIGTTWSNLIEDATWKVSGHSTESVTPSEMCAAEIENATKTYGPSDGTSKIGLVYLSDYGFAASPSAWTKNLFDYNSADVNGTSITTINWMYMGDYEWTISPNSSYSNVVFYLDGDGYVDNYPADNGFGSRPVLYLKASVLYAGGSGTKDSPITLVV